MSLGYRMSLQWEGVAGQPLSSAPCPSHPLPQAPSGAQAPQPESVLHGDTHAGRKHPHPQELFLQPLLTLLTRSLGPGPLCGRDGQAWGLTCQPTALGDREAHQET